MTLEEESRRCHELALQMDAERQAKRQEEAKEAMKDALTILVSFLAGGLYVIVFG